MSAGKRDQIEIFFKKKFLSKIDVDLIIWSRTFIISKKIILSIWSLFPALTPYYIQQELLNGSYKLKEINGKILKTPVNGELLKKYNSREEFVPYVVV